MFVAGLAIVRAHNRWAPDWTVLVTLSGWFSRSRAVPHVCRGPLPARSGAHERKRVHDPSLSLEGVFLVVGFVLSFKACKSR